MNNSFERIEEYVRPVANTFMIDPIDLRFRNWLILIASNPGLESGIIGGPISSILRNS